MLRWSKGKALATAVATSGAGPISLGQPEAQAISSAETINGAMAQAMSSATGGATNPPSLVATATAKTSFLGVMATATAPGPFEVFGATVTADAIAEGGSAQTFVAQDTSTAISIALPDKAYATTLIGGASNVADALLGPSRSYSPGAVLFRDFHSA
jgi:hypothetical protein